MLNLFWAVLGAMRSLFRTQRELALENLALRQQVAVLIRARRGQRLRLRGWDRAFWVILSQQWPGWRDTLATVKPATVVARQYSILPRRWPGRAACGSLRRRQGTKVATRQVSDITFRGGFAAEEVGGRLAAP